MTLWAVSPETALCQKSHFCVILLCANVLGIGPLGGTQFGPSCRGLGALATHLEVPRGGGGGPAPLVEAQRPLQQQQRPGHAVPPTRCVQGLVRLHLVPARLEDSATRDKV